MSMFELDEKEIEALVGAVAVAGGRSGEAPPLREYFARATWTAIAEPGDRFAWSLIDALGAFEALTVLVEGRSAEVVARRLAESGIETVPPLDDLAKALARWSPRVNPNGTMLSLREAARYDARLLVPSDSLWPGGLDDLGQFAPIALWVRGTDAAVSSLGRGIALVGARAATGYGEHVTMEASAGLVDRGYSIVSGAAYGIDGMAHRAALASSGETIAFLAGGVDRFYPSGHDALLSRIVEKGAVMSEVPCGTAPTKWRFLQRNRLIAAASRATIVLEAGWRSGSLNTAGHASTLGRPLGAVPGPVTSAASAGCHRLIRDFQATCVTNADEMAELAPLGALTAPTGYGDVGLGRNPTQPPGPPGVQQQSASVMRLLDAVSARSQRAATDIAARCGLSLDHVRALLGVLELEGRVREEERGWVRVQ